MGNNPGFESLKENLRDAEGLHLILHGDAPLSGEKVPLLANADGEHEAVPISAWVRVVQPHVSHLRHAYLGGCETLDLGWALHHEAGVETVVCWQTKLLDSVGPVFG